MKRLTFTDLLVHRYEKAIGQIIEVGVGIHNRVARNRLNELCVHSNIVVKENGREAKPKDLRKGNHIIASPEISHPISHPANYLNSAFGHKNHFLPSFLFFSSSLLLHHFFPSIGIETTSKTTHPLYNHLEQQT
jgi:hypothetical protein